MNESEGLQHIDIGKHRISVGPSLTDPEVIDFGLYDGGYEFASTELDQDKLKELISLLQTFVKTIPVWPGL